MYAYPIYPQRNTCFLDGFWEFALLEKNLNLKEGKICGYCLV